MYYIYITGFGEFLEREELKKLVAEKAVEQIKDGMIVGLGTGSTMKYTLKKLGELVREGLKIQGIRNFS